MTRDRGKLLASALGAALLVLLSTLAYAHCDGIDGPVVKAAQDALARGDVDLVLIWVRPDDEAEIRKAFDRTMSVRKLSPPARELADAYFFETLVRIHRAGEGAAFTGLKPAGRDLGPAIPAADQALASGDVGPLTSLLVDRIRAGVSELYERAATAKAYQPDDVEAGREYVEAYVTFIHYVERVYEAATRRVEGHYAESAEESHHEE